MSNSEFLCGKCQPKPIWCKSFSTSILTLTTNRFVTFTNYKKQTKCIYL